MTQFRGRLTHSVRSTQGVGSAFLGVVVWISDATALRLTRMGLDQSVTEVDAHELGVAAHFDVGAWETERGWNGVESVLEADMMVRVDLQGRPAGCIERVIFQRQETSLLFIEENGESPSAEGWRVVPWIRKLATSKHQCRAL
ncbi:MAG: hypothetical protein M1305_07200 [Candidatus Marsarchaeota archaeon]|nr:hypothetical protein [Candidatus Marsarchaeota archaeon]